MSTQTVIETATGWMIRCRCRKSGWHEFPKKGRHRATWTFDGNLCQPTFTPSMNECSNPKDVPDHNPDLPTHRCHFVVTRGKISYCGDCTHDSKGQTFDLEPWPQSQIDYYAALLNANSGTGHSAL